MHLSDIAATQTAGPQIPFWLQILTISLSPALGFIGVAVGASMSERNRRNAYIKEERRKTYQDYLEVLSQLTAFSTMEYNLALKNSKERHEELSQAILKLSSFTESLSSVYLRIRLVGSPDAANEARAAFNFMGIVTGLAEVTLRDGYEASNWAAVTQLGAAIQTRFAETARKDLGLPRREIGLPPLTDTATAIDYEELVHNFFRETRESKE